MFLTMRSATLSVLNDLVEIIAQRVHQFDDLATETLSSTEAAARHAGTPLCLAIMRIAG